MHNEGNMIERLSSDEMNVPCLALIASVIIGFVQEYAEKCSFVHNIEERSEDKWEKELGYGYVSLEELCPTELENEDIPENGHKRYDGDNI